MCPQNSWPRVTGGDQVVQRRVAAADVHVRAADARGGDSPDLARLCSVRSDRCRRRYWPGEESWTPFIDVMVVGPPVAGGVFCGYKRRNATRET